MSPLTTPTVTPPAPGTLPPAPSRLRVIARLIRPRHWVKNGFVLAPALFAGVLTQGPAFARALLAAALFSLVASAVYVMNDVADAERDRHHPLKRLTRPVAAGQISVRGAVRLMVVLFVAAAAGTALLPAVAVPLALYVALNVAYSHRLKHVPVVDLFCISAGFMARVWAGALAVDVPLSSWMVITTMALTLYLAAVKRRQELAGSGAEGRLVLRTYSVALLDQYAQTAAVATILFYSLYIIEVRPELVISVPLVLFGIFRYWYTVQHVGGSESPVDALWNDPPLAVTIVAWAAACIYVLGS